MDAAVAEYTTLKARSPYLIASAVSLAQFVERFRDRALQNPRTVSIKLDVDLLEPPDKIDNVAPRHGSTGRRAKMRSASERTIFVDQTMTGRGLEHGARAVRIFWQGFSTGGAQRPRGKNCFALREIWSATGQSKMTTLGLAQAVPFDRPLRKIDIYLSHFRERALHLVLKQVSTIHVAKRVRRRP
jgi:hypothetical protein